MVLFTDLSLSSSSPESSPPPPPPNRLVAVLISFSVMSCLLSMVAYALSRFEKMVIGVRLDETAFTAAAGRIPRPTSDLLLSSHSKVSNLTPI